MKQTKKMTRNQRQFLLKKKINIENVRIIEETKEYLKIMNGDKVETVYKNKK